MAPVFLLKNWLYNINIVFIIKLYYLSATENSTFIRGYHWLLLMEYFLCGLKSVDDFDATDKISE